MKYILNPKIALRSWTLVPRAYYVKGEEFAKGLKREEFELLLACDGKTDLAGSPLLEELQRKELIIPCVEEKELSEWQRYRHCENRYFPKINWMITGKCNYNCLHCFNAADNAPLMSEWSLEEAKRLLDEAQLCGINSFTVTGGEPMLHPNFFELMEEIYRRDMFVDELNTNGYFINQQTLERMKDLGCRAMIKISFDGIGHHDWLRNRRGAQEDALRAIRLCVDNGFRVMVQTNVHRKNVDSMLETAKLLDAAGVDSMRIIRTTEAPRWVQNAGNACLELAEYYDHMADLVSRYIKTDCKMRMIIWQYMFVHPHSRSYSLIPVQYDERTYRDTLPVCKGNRGMVAVAANGNVFPCHQLSGYYEQHKDILGNVKTGSLQKLLQDSTYLDEVCTTVDKVREHDQKCNACRFFLYCAGGCRAIALALTGDKLAADPSKCIFFTGGYYEKALKAMEGYHNLSPMQL